MNGCPNSCARFQVADIGLMSALQPRPDGTRSDAFLVHLGGGMGEGAAFGRKVKGVKVFAEDSADYLRAAAHALPAAARIGATSFAEFVNALDDEQLARVRAPPVGRARDEHAARRARSTARSAASRTCGPTTRRAVAVPGLRAAFELTVTGGGMMPT